eukprot:8077932-Alexandrium_andersonii.AAC.1
MSERRAEAARAAYVALSSLSFDRLRAASGPSEDLIQEYLKFIACKAAFEDYYVACVACPAQLEA